MPISTPIPAEPDPLPAAPPPDDSSEGRILVVDDDPVICQVLSKILQRGGYKFVETARDAVTQATYSSKAIISDVMDGAKLVIALPEVAAKIMRPEDCSLTKTATMPHN